MVFVSVHTTYGGGGLGGARLCRIMCVCVCACVCVCVTMRTVLTIKNVSYC